MVQFEEVTDEHFEQNFKKEEEWSDTDSEISESEIEDDVVDETFYDRLVALKDIIPPTQRTKIANAASSLANTATWLGKFGGKATWVLATSAILFGFPLALAIEEEAQYTEYEKQMQMQAGANDANRGPDRRPRSPGFRS
ncbi:hypothetical protein G7K_0106-t1 [Saitoella complicata NRRL Y-17804]|uniref:Mitochondrial import receptor subunit tom22 n=1 Tax=Saitoella complicata (strain BCRC 22490 / CBS 7301 / JCM 7358 / NBRC 10748 / NRRL Y-17804) TaxID=698492 RepID=A0A0E9N7R4_SAICN|nr:hypothetical protein G7K_0106-t1 [Saitoella complicata NRRL Y-17804]